MQLMELSQLLDLAIDFWNNNQIRDNHLGCNLQVKDIVTLDQASLLEASMSDT